MGTRSNVKSVAAAAICEMRKAGQMEPGFRVLGRACEPG